MTDEQRQRIWEIENSCDGRTELAERIVGLEDAYAQKVKSSDDYMMQLMSCEISLDGMHLIYGIMSDRYDEVIDLLRDARDEYVELRDELEQWHRLTANIELPEYPITQFQPKDLERENARLRELMNVMAYCNQYGRACDGCRINGGAGTITERAGCDVLLDLLRELGIEVN